jgi:hypothetical protein
MSTIVMWSRRVLLAALIAALSLAAAPQLNGYALEAIDPVTPPTGQVSTDRLEQVWAREQAACDRLGTFLDRVDGRISKAQELIEKARTNGRDVSAVQAALDAFAEAVKQAHPLYEGLKGILSSHQGFDANGKVVDQEKALQTVKDTGSKLREIRRLLVGPGKALREAVRAFREANRPAGMATPAPNSP